MPVKANTQDVVAKFKQVHGENTYDYSKVVYSKAKTPVTIICQKHGEFEQRPDTHLTGAGCKLCGTDKTNNSKVKTLEYYLPKFIEKHGNKYDYSKAVYTASDENITIICSTHGEFQQTPSNHVVGKGCNKCGREITGQARKVGLQSTLEAFQLAHGDKYGYDKVPENVKAADKVEIFCKVHQEYFLQAPAQHKKGIGCPKCGRERAEIAKADTLESFIEKANKVHNFKYSYAKSVYTESHARLIITCPTHGDFKQIANGHTQGSGCPKCVGNISKAEQEIADFLKQYIDLVQSDRSQIDNLELDIYIPSKNLAIEYNGLYWHSDVKKEDNYHLNKYKACQQKGIRLIQIFEDEYRDKPQIVKSRLLNLIGETPRKIYARQCELKEVTSGESMKFLAENHIQGALGATHRIGLYLEDELVSLMTFGEMRKNLGSTPKQGHFELLRFCNKVDTNVVGAASRSLKHFLKLANPIEITSFADLRWSQGELYNTLGFDLEYQTEPNYYYTKGIDRENRFKYRKSELVRKGLDANKTERQLMSEQGFYRIYDTGSLKYKLKTNR